MGDVLIDACGWVALIDGSFNIDVALSNLVGPPHFILIGLVQQELEEIEANRPRGKKLMLDLLMQRSTLLIIQQCTRMMHSLKWLMNEASLFSQLMQISSEGPWKMELGFLKWSREKTSDWLMVYRELLSRILFAP